jgi:CheY-like chemotaxis protein
MNGPVGEIPIALRAADDGQALAKSSVERARVLLVDDDERNLLAIATVLEDLGEVVLARSGEEALRHLLKGEFAVILLDVYMPGMDGYETAQIIRSRDQTKGIPIVFLSAVNKEAEHLLRGYSMGAVDYVFKPVTRSFCARRWRCSSSFSRSRRKSNARHATNRHCSMPTCAQTQNG